MGLEQLRSWLHVTAPSRHHCMTVQEDREFVTRVPAKTSFSTLAPGSETTARCGPDLFAPMNVMNTLICQIRCCDCTPVVSIAVMHPFPTIPRPHTRVLLRERMHHIPIYKNVIWLSPQTWDCAISRSSPTWLGLWEAGGSTTVISGISKVELQAGRSGGAS